MFFLIWYYILMQLLMTKSSTVYDKEDERKFVESCSKMDRSEYCQKISDCEPGSHIFCLYYTPKQVMSPACGKSFMVRLRDESKKQILDKLNEIRSQTAKGKMQGEDKVILPQAYGLHRLEWDADLALFAQVWANQCHFSYDDHCRATKKFKHPGQIIGVSRFTYPDWKLSDPANQGNLLKKCLTQAKVNYALEKILDLLLTDRTSSVSLDHVRNYRDTGVVNSYLKAMNGNNTHVGCGMSAYRDYHWENITQNHNHYTLELVCNLSHRPIVGLPVYNMTTPSPWEDRCGCPDNYYSDEDCLCVRSSSTIPATFEPALTNRITTIPATMEPTTNSISPIPTTTSKPEKKKLRTDCLRTKNQTPAVIVFPIIAVENAPLTENPTTGEERRYSWDSANDLISRGNSRKFFWTNQNMDILDKQPSETQNMSYLQHLNLLDRIKSLNTNSSMYQTGNFYLNNMSIVSLLNYLNYKDFGHYAPNMIASSNKNILAKVQRLDNPSQNHNKHEENVQNSASLEHKLKMFQNETPGKDLSFLEKILMNFIIDKQNHLRESPLLRPLKKYKGFNQAGTEIQKPNINIDDKNYIEPDDDSKEIDDGKPDTVVPTFEENVWLKNTKRSGNLIRSTETIEKDMNKAIRRWELQSQFTIPIIRKQTSLVNSGGKAKYNIDNHNTEDSETRISDYSVLNDIRSINDDKVTDDEINTKEVESKYKVENKKSDKSAAMNDFIVDRRTYLTHEISKLKNKLRNLRQYLRQTDVAEKERFRPVMTSRNERRNTKLNNIRRVYIADPAHSMDDF